MKYTADGEISWGVGKLNYVTEPGGKIVFVSARAEKTFSAGFEIYDIKNGGRKYIAGLSQLKDGYLNATVTDSSKSPDGSSATDTGNLCSGKKQPAAAAQGVWSLAVKYLQIPKTTMSCMRLGKLDMTDTVFAFDGKTIQAGASSFSESDAQFTENLIIDPTDQKSTIVYKVDAANGTGVALGLNEQGKLLYAEIEEKKMIVYFAQANNVIDGCLA